MAAHIQGPLYYERIGRAGPVMAFVHPNPLDHSCWMFQTAHFSTWYRCIAVDLPGYGRSPRADAGLTITDVAEACWEAIDDAFPGEPAILVGCSIGAALLPWMHNLRPERTRAIVVCGAGYDPTKEFALRRIKFYTDQGVDYRWDYTLEGFSPAFRATPIAHYFAELFSERNDLADVETIIRQFEALRQPEPEGHHARIACPMLIITGSEDVSHQRAFALRDRVRGAELRVLHGAGHACHMEQPWLFDRMMIEFLDKHRLLPGSPQGMVAP
jgi:pimeloyl-ACP methyl ester carboxylesterase